MTIPNHITLDALRQMPIGDIAALPSEQLALLHEEADAALKAAKTGGPIGSEISVNAQGAGPGFGAHICDIEIDPETGLLDPARLADLLADGRVRLVAFPHCDGLRSLKETAQGGLAATPTGLALKKRIFGG